MKAYLVIKNIIFSIAIAFAVAKFTELNLGGLVFGSMILAAILMIFDFKILETISNRKKKYRDYTKR